MHGKYTMPRTKQTRFCAVGIVMMQIVTTICSATAVKADEANPVPANASTSVPNFSLLDYRGRHFELNRANARVVVLYFTGNGCPVARQQLPKLLKLNRDYLPQDVTFWMVNSVPQNDFNEITLRMIAQMGLNDKLAQFIPHDEPGLDAISRLNSMSKLKGIQAESQILGDPETFKLQVIEGTLGPLTLLRDEQQLIAHHFGITRLSEVVAIDTVTKTVIYRGSIDDQMKAGGQKPAPSRNYLVDALDEFLHDRPITVRRTAAEGCLIQFPDRLKKHRPSYVKEIAPVLRTKCAGCHQAGQIGPFPLGRYEDVLQWSAMIQEVVLDKRMPPWDADPHFGKFSNDSSLSPAETQSLLRWIELGLPRDEGEDPLATPFDPQVSWKLGEPDFIARLPQQEEIPANGLLDYRYLQPEFVMPHDGWLRASVIRPGNPQVVHHILVRIIYPADYAGPRADAYVFDMWAPGVPPSICPADTGRFVPKGARFQFEVHYTTNGTVQHDQSEMGLYLSPQPPKMQLDTRVAETRDLMIPPGEPNAEHLSMYCFQRPALLYNVGPHMHLRGKRFRAQLLYPDGRRETILNVPRYDFNWQVGHIFAAPLKIPAGTWILCTGAFDNSESNPRNPDSKTRVRFGLQTSDEMFMGFLTVADLPESKPIAVTNTDAPTDQKGKE